MKRVLLPLLIVLGLTSCGGGGGGGGPAPAPPITVSISPTAVTVTAGATQQFTATVRNTSNTAVMWKVNDVEGGSVTTGNISTSGLYTAPLSPPASGQVTVKAVSQADSTKSASATVTIGFASAALNGQYAFSFKGLDANGLFYIAGSFNADGSGNITNGIEDLNDGTGVYPSLSFTGTYSVGADGNGSASLMSSRGTANLGFVLVSSDKALVMEFDTSANGSGSIQKQDGSSFLNSALVGGYSFGFDGISGFGPISAAGRFTADGAGGISAGAEDVNDAGLVSSNVAFTGTYDIASTGRGTATLTSALGQSQFSFYMISANEAVFVSLDFVPALLGAALKQESPAFSNASLSGDYAFASTGFTTMGPVSSTGRFTANGAGALSAGVLDEDENGTLSDNIPFTGVYAVAPNGRGTVTLTAGGVDTNLAFYMVSSSVAFAVELSTTSATSAVVNAQQGMPFSASSVAGDFGYDLSGWVVNDRALDSLGQLTLSSTGSITGTSNINQNGTLTPALAVSGSYSVASNGRATASITGGGVTSQFRFYIVSSSKVFIVEMETDEVLIGVAEKQF